MEKNDSTEIDLYHLIISFVKFFYKYRLLLLIFVVLAAIFAFVNFKMQKGYYETKLVLVPKEATFDELNLLITIISEKVQNNDNYWALEKMQMNKDAFSSIKSISGNIQKDSKDELNVFLSVDLKVYDTIYIGEIQKSIIHYFESNEMLNKKIAISKATLTEVRANVENQILKIDSLQNLLLDYNKSEQFTIIGSNTGLTSDYLTLITKKTEIDQKLEYMTPALIIKDFNTTRVLIKDKMNSVFLFFIISFLGIIVAAKIQFLRWLKKNNYFKDNV